LSTTPSATCSASVLYSCGTHRYFFSATVFPPDYTTSINFASLQRKAKKLFFLTRRSLLAPFLPWLKRFGLELVRAVMSTERSQQILCDTDMPRILLTNFRPALASVQHPLHDYVSLLFGLLTAHSLTPRDFRDFLRLSGSFCEHADAQTGSAQSVVLGVPGSRHSLIFESHDGLPLLTDFQLGKSAATLELPALDNITELIEETVWRQRSASQLFSQWVSPRDAGGGVDGDSSALVASTVAVCLPAFVEFDMSPEGFACLFLPSIAPQRIHAAPQLTGSPPSTVSSEIMCAGGVGSGERIFPPQGGLTFCSWVCVDDFGLGQSCSNLGRLPPHPVRLLTVVRGVQGTNEQSVCLAAWLDPLTRSIFVTSKARLLSPDFLLHCQAPEDAHWIVFRTQSPRIAGGQAWPVGSWRHVALVFTRGYMFEMLDGGPINTSVCAFIGTPPVLYQHSCLRWRQGPFQLIEEPLTASQVALIACLGPEYIGSLQAPSVPPAGEDCLQPLFAEEKLSFAVYGSSSTTLTISRIRKVYNATDATLIANVVCDTSTNLSRIRGSGVAADGGGGVDAEEEHGGGGSSSVGENDEDCYYFWHDLSALVSPFILQLRTQTRDNLTPIRVLLNVAFLLSGPSRCLGAVLVGYNGVRVFTPRPLASLLDSVANPSALLLSLVALSRSRAQLTNTLRAVFCVIDSSVAISIDMKRSHGYQLLVHILRRKNRFLDEGIVDLVLKLAFGNMIPLASQNNSSVSPPPLSGPTHTWKVDVFTDLLCDLRLWVRKVPQKDKPFSTRRDFSLVAYLLNQLMGNFKNLFDLPYKIHSPSLRKSSSTNGMKSRKFVDVGLVEYLFNNTVYLILDVIHEAEQLLHSTSTPTLADDDTVLQQLNSGYFADPIASAIRMLGVLLLSTPTVSILHHFSQLLIWTLPKKNESEKITEISNENDPLLAEGSLKPPASSLVRRAEE
uniref:DUF4704 domain-containing protein n=1 Tax=Schistocephalus solidus TaxID=70667 RepID=A0A183SHG9_SCHSO